MKLTGFNTFFLGNAKFMLKLNEEQERAKTEGLRPLLPSMLWLLSHHESDGGETKGYEAGRDPILIVNMGSEVNVFIADPEIVQEMLVTKNAEIDKTGAFEVAFKNFFGHSFLFAKSDVEWRAKRKAVAHAFYKDRLTQMIYILRDQIKAVQAQWIERI